MEKTFFALRGALEYATVGVRGAPLYRFKKGEPLAVLVPEDIRKFRGQPDRFVECDEKGAPKEAAGAAQGAAPAPKSFKAFQPEPPAPPRPPPPPRKEPPIEAPKPAAPAAGNPSTAPADSKPAGKG